MCVYVCSAMVDRIMIGLGWDMIGEIASPKQHVCSRIQRIPVMAHVSVCMSASMCTYATHALTLTRMFLNNQETNPWIWMHRW